MKLFTHGGRRAALAIPLAGVTALGVTALSGATTPAAGAVTHPACRTSQLVVWQGLPGSGTAGSIYYELQFSNVSSTACAMVGFPGVSAVSSTGTQLGSAAARDHSFAPRTVVLAPGATAHAVLRIVDAGAFPAASCRPVTATGLKVYPPNTTTAEVMPFRFAACSRKGPVFLYVRTVRPGAGIPGYSQ